MDANYMGALKAFLSHHPTEMPIDPGAADPLRRRGQDRPDLKRRVPLPTPGAASAPSGAELLPLILAQLPLEKSYRLGKGG